MMDFEALRARVRDGERFDYLLFWGHRVAENGSVGSSCLSQWYPASFVVNGVTYRTAEHWMMAGKARLFGDEETLDAIVAAEDPNAAKKLGRAVRGFDDARWKEACRAIVTEGNVHKFEQNPKLGAFLRATGEKVLVEASPYDRIWGIGLSATSPGGEDPLAWRGQNLLGFALMDAREQLRR